MHYIETLKSNKDIFFNFMKDKYPVYNNSNIFHKDILYAIQSFFERKNSQLSYSLAENLTEQFTEYLENTGDLVKLDNNTWKVNFSLKTNVINETEA